jgi:hypothetical protein
VHILAHPALVPGASHSKQPPFLRRLVHGLIEKLRDIGLTACSATSSHNTTVPHASHGVIENLPCLLDQLRKLRTFQGKVVHQTLVVRGIKFANEQHVERFSSSTFLKSCRAKRCDFVFSGSTRLSGYFLQVMKIFNRFEFLTFTHLRSVKVPPYLQVKPKIGRYPKKLRQA